MSSLAEKSFFEDISNLLPDQKPRLSYGVAVTDFDNDGADEFIVCLLYTSPSPRDSVVSRMPSSA